MPDSIESEHAAEERPARRRSANWHLVALLLFTLAALVTFRDVLRAGPMSSAMVSSSKGMLPISKGDVVFEAWLTARNAHTIATAPHRLFDTPHCAPAEKTLTLGVHMITMGLLAVPIALITTNPALAYNFSTFLLLVISMHIARGLGTLAGGLDDPEVPTDLPLLEWVRLGCDDLRNWYMEAAQGQPGRAHSSELQEWFWRQTAFARLIASAAMYFVLSADGGRQIFGRRAMVPRVHMRQLMPDVEPSMGDLP